jgi:hypothetical protein
VIPQNFSDEEKWMYPRLAFRNEMRVLIDWEVRLLLAPEPGRHRNRRAAAAAKFERSDSDSKFPVARSGPAEEPESSGCPRTFFRVLA